MEVGGPHHLPHFHAYYQDDVAVIGVDPIEMIAGTLPRRQRRLVEAWAELHQEELIADWERLQAGRRGPAADCTAGVRNMQHPIYRVCAFRIIDDYVLAVTFDDETEQTIDFRPVLAGKLLGPLRDLALFNQVQIDREVHTLVWPNGADFDPATLHDWPEHADALEALARKWEPQSA